MLICWVTVWALAHPLAMAYRVLRSHQVRELVPNPSRGNRRYPVIDWPLDDLQVGEALAIPIGPNGRDKDGRTVQHLRYLAYQRSCPGPLDQPRRYSTHKVPGALLVRRVR